MPITVKLDRKISDGVWSAVGSFSSGNNKGPADVLLKQGEDNSFSLILDSKVHVSKIMNKEVQSYVHATPAFTQGAPLKGSELVFRKLGFKLKK